MAACKVCGCTMKKCTDCRGSGKKGSSNCPWCKGQGERCPLEDRHKRS